MRDRHYQDAYNMLVIMFGSIVILPPRTKRWAEAKVLVDCMNIKVTLRIPRSVFPLIFADMQAVPVQQRARARARLLHLPRAQIRRLLARLGHR